MTEVIELPEIGKCYKKRDKYDPAQEKKETFEVATIYKNSVIGYRKGKNYHPTQEVGEYYYLDEIPDCEFFKFFENNPL